MPKSLPGLLLGLALPLLSQAQPTPATPQRPPELESMGIGPDFTVQYQDIDGKSLTYAQFEQAPKGKSFNIRKNLTTHMATLRLMSAADIAAAKQQAAHPSRYALQGKPFPAFAATTLDGRKVSLADYHGKRLLLNFFSPNARPALPRRRI